VEISLSKIIALLIGVGYFAYLLIHNQTTHALLFRNVAIPIIVMTLACIWFPDAMGAASYQGGLRRKSPSFLVTFMGWVFLIVLMPVLFYFWR
jgi:hypothetical protein